MVALLLRWLKWPLSEVSFYVIVKTPPRVRMRNAAQGVCQVLNTVRGVAECSIYHETRKGCGFICTSISSALNGILYLTTVN